MAISRSNVSAAVVVLALMLVGASAVRMVTPAVQAPTGYTKLRSSGQSTLYAIQLPTNDTQPGHSYATPPLVLDLHGTRTQIGYDYAALLHAETVDTMHAFLSTVYPDPKDQALISKFAQFCWDSFLSKYTPPSFLAELDGMNQWHAEAEAAGLVTSNVTTAEISARFYALANMPADEVNIVSMLEQELEAGWPEWLKEVVNEIIKLLLHLKHHCDAYGVWGSRTQDGLLYSSRNLDYEPDTGINRHKLVTFYHINDPSFGGVPPGGAYASIGFAFGLGALAGISEAGITTSEMNLDNSRVTFSGVPFPLRLRMVLESATDLETAMTTWNATNNTNSFNFLIGSAPDALRLRKEGPGATGDGAYALETIMGFTAQFGANSTVERDATYNCSAPHAKCWKWTNQTGEVHIGKPIAEAVWRTNHGMSPVVMATQEPLFNGTIFRYDIMHDLFVNLAAEGSKIGDADAIGIVATAGTKGVDFFTCDQTLDGDNIMSIAYMPGPRGPAGSKGHFYVAWESGSNSTWRPAACAPYVAIELADWV